MRYGTHVIVSAKFGGEFKLMHTMRKSKVRSIESFAETCIQDSMQMFSRSWQVNVNLLVAQVKKSETNSKQNKANNNTENKQQDAHL